ncbi:hypothetical protein GCM10009590_11940 [Brachybacterium alimentarium]
MGRPGGAGGLMTDDALYTARVDNSGGTSGRVTVHDGPVAPPPVPPGAAAGPEAEASDVAASGVEASEAETSEVEASEVAPSPVVLPTGAPTPAADGFNPEQFLAMAWSTCLGETLRVVLAERGLPHESSVSVEVGLHRDPAGGFRFVPRALVAIEQMPADEAREIAGAAHARCPVSKLLTGQCDPVLEVVDTPGAAGAPGTPDSADCPDSADGPDTPGAPEPT